jgi:hypothetical protein
LSSDFRAADGEKQAILAQALAYVALGMRIFPVDARKRPIGSLTPHGVKQASDNPKIIRYWWDYAPFADWAWALPDDVLVLDIDVKNKRDGFRDFRQFDGRDPYAIDTPMASTPSGGLQLFFDVTEPYRGLAPAVKGTGLDTRAVGNYAVLPLRHNGRAWIKDLAVKMAAAPAWLDCAKLSAAPESRPTPKLAAGSPRAKQRAQSELKSARVSILAAPCGAQECTLHVQCHYIGRAIARGELDYDSAYEALLAVALRMKAYRDPWREDWLRKHTERSIKTGMDWTPGEPFDNEPPR